MSFNRLEELVCMKNKYNNITSLKSRYMEGEINLILVIQPGSEVHKPVESRPEVNIGYSLQNLESEAVNDVKPVITNAFGPVVLLDVDECASQSCIQESNQIAATPDVETDVPEEAVVKITGPKEKVQKCKGQTNQVQKSTDCRNQVQKSTYVKRGKKCTDTTKAEQRSEGEGTNTLDVPSVGHSLFKATLMHHVKKSSASIPCSPDTIHTCRVCGGVFQQLDSFQKHILEHKKLQRCEICGKYFRFASTFTSHILSCKTKEKTVSTLDKASPKAHSCRYYGEVSSPEHLKLHCRKYTRGRPPKCDFCGKSFINNSELRRHKCRYCRKHFCPEHLKQHIKKHKGDRPPRCEICGKTFVYHSELRKHKQFHSSERKYPCKECGKSFKSEGNLKQHVIVHSSERPHKCPTCNKAFNRRHTVRGHMLTHLGQKL